MTLRPEPLLSATVVAYLGRAGRPQREGGPLTPVEVARAFIAAPELSAYKYAHFEFLVPLAQQVALAAGAVLCGRGAELPGAWLILDGRVSADDRAAPFGQGSGRRGSAAGAGEGAAALGPGAIAGVEALLGAHAATRALTAEDRRSRRCSCPAGVLRRATEIFPDLALALLAQKIAA